MAGQWRYGLLPLAVLWLAVNGLETGRIEADLADRARRALEAQGFKWAAPQVEGRDVRLTGVIIGDDSGAAALAAAAPGVRKVVNALSAAPKTPEPAPKPEPKPEEPANPIVAPVPSAAPALAASHGKVGAEASRVSPYLFQAEAADGKLTLTGFYPDAESHGRIARAASGLGRELVDRMQAGAGAPKDFVEAAEAGLGQLLRLREGALQLRDRVARLSGEAASAELADDIRATFVAALPGGFSARPQLTGPARELSTKERAGAPRLEKLPAATSAEQSPEAAPKDANRCQARMAALVAERPIVFRVGSSRLAPGSAAILDAVAAEAKQCPGVAFEVGGHTDDIGYVSENIELSRRRAEAVLVYLVSAGVAPKRLTAVGYGERRPLVPNDNDDNRAKNRRIEFTVK